MSHSLDLDSPIDDYQPAPPFDIDVRPISGDDLRRWRSGLWLTHTQADIADVLGITSSVYGGWEREGLEQPCWAALIRAWYVDDIADIDNQPAPAQWCKNLAALVGGWKGLADALGLHYETLRGQWSQRGTGQTGGKGPLIRWMCDELDPPEVKSLRFTNFGRQSFEPSDIRQIRRRLNDGDRVASIAADYEVRWQTIRSIDDNETWRWVS